MAKTKAKDTAAGPKKRNDAYTMMLFLTLLALGIGCTLMYLDWDEYGQKSPPAEKVPPMPKLGTIPAPTQGTKPGDEKKSDDMTMPDDKGKTPDDKGMPPDDGKGKDKDAEGKTGRLDRPAAELPFLPVAFATTTPVAFADRAPLPLPRLGASAPGGFDALPGVIPPAN